MVICVLGRQPEIGSAELESLYGSDAVRRAGDSCALVDAPVDFNRLGGSSKAANLLATLPDSSRKTIFNKIASLLPSLVDSLPTKGKIKLGLSVYGLNLSPYELGGEALRLKKLIRSKGRSVRVVPNETPALSSAQTFHNRLTGELGLEFIIVSDGSETHIGRVTAVQDIDAYRIRDRERPKRDAFVGMLPPKLAQIIINLAVGKMDTTTILDPFCGTGVVLQEALLMGYNAYGSDIHQKMIDYSGTNLKWLKDKLSIDGEIRLETADATDHIWRQPINVIACETYLGQPLGGQTPTREKMTEIVHDTNTVIRGFFKNIAPQLTAGTRLCVAVPAWTTGGETYHLPVLDELSSLGFERGRFETTSTLIYRRDNQVTGRELVVLIKQ